MQVPLLDLRAQSEIIRAEAESVILEICRTQAFILGPRVEQFEGEAARYCGCRYALGVSSGTDAILMALMALDIGPGDEVVTVPNTAVPTAGAPSVAPALSTIR